MTYVDTYRHQSSKAKIQLACLKFYADQDIIDAKYALYSEFSDILGEPQARLDSSNRTKAEKSLEDIYSALQALDECNETLNFVALNLKRVPNFSPEEIDLTSMLERLSKIERRVENVEETCSLTMVEQINTNEKVKVMQKDVKNIVVEKSERTKSNYELC